MLTCGGMFDQMSEGEATFLVSALGLFRNVQDQGRAVPRANVNLVRAYNTADFYRGLSGAEDILHLIAHADSTTLQTGNSRSGVVADELQRRAARGNVTVAPIVISTCCSFQSAAWRAALREAGATILIAAPQAVSPANLAAFDMAFYSALLSRVRRGKETVQRVRESFTIANRHYRAVHAEGTPFARFSLERL